MPSAPPCCFITHDLTIAGEICDRIAVMYGRRDHGDRRSPGPADHPAAPLHRRPCCALPARSTTGKNGCSKSPASPPAIRVPHSTPAASPVAAARSCPAAATSIPPRSSRMTAGLSGASSMPPDLLRAEGLRLTFNGVRGLDDVSLSVGAGETIGLVGESGSGKTTLGKNVGAAHPSGGRDASSSTAPTWRRSARPGSAPHRRALQMVFQDPLASFNPRFRIGASLALPMRLHRIIRRNETRDAVAAALTEVGLDPTLARRFPARTLGRTAPARRHRPRRQPAPTPGGRGRGGIKTRRLRARADPEPPARHKRPDTTSPSCSSPTTSVSPGI